MKSALLLPLFSFTHAAHAQSSGTCYFANGTALPDTPDYSAYEPCISGATTTCCGTKRTLPPGAIRQSGFTRDECLPNGLCQNRYLTVGEGVEKISSVPLSPIFPNPQPFTTLTLTLSRLHKWGLC